MWFVPRESTAPDVGTCAQSIVSESATQSMASVPAAQKAGWDQNAWKVKHSKILSFGDIEIDMLGV